MPRLKTALTALFALVLTACPAGLEAPKITLTSSATTVQTESTLRLSLDLLDAPRGVKSVAFFDGSTQIATFGPGAAYAFDVQVTAALNGLREYTARVTDATDITATSNPVRVTVNITAPDTQAPSVTLTPSSSAVNAAGWVRLTANATDNRAVTHVDFLVNGELYFTDQVAPFQYDLVLSNANNGALSVKAVARDAAGNSTPSADVPITVNIPVTADLEPPTLRVTGNTRDVYQGDVLTLTASATDNVGVTRVAFFKEGEFVAERTGAPYTLDVPLSKADNGSRTITVYAFDAGGNKRAVLYNVFVNL
jgi:hypothetical protein